MKWDIDFGNRPWRRWFAWFPVRVGNQRVWWEYVERQTTNCQGYICHDYRVVGTQESSLQWSNE